MHLLVAQGRTIEEAETPVDLGQSPGDLVVLSFSDSDLGILAARAEAAPFGFSVRLASLAQLKHPYSIDLYIERTIAQARFVVVRLLGGLDYWRYGVEELARVARERRIALAILPGDHRQDRRLEAASTLPPAELHRLWRFFQEGGETNIDSLLGWVATYLGYARPWSEPGQVPAAGRYAPACRTASNPRGHALLVFYRSMMLASDVAPILALSEALAALGLDVIACYATSLKDPAAAARLRDEIVSRGFDVVVNTTAFSGRGEDAACVLDEADVPVIQAILAGASEQQWRANSRGLGPADLAMNVVLPEMDGRLISAAISCKAESPRSAALEFTRLVHRPIASRIAFVADLAAAWVDLRRTPPSARRLALVLSDYPGRAGRAAYAVGLDTPASVTAICADLAEAGYTIGPLPPSAALMARLEGQPAGTAHLALSDYRDLLAHLPPAFVASVTAAWGDPAQDAALIEGRYCFRVIEAGHLIIALQPDRGARATRRADYHDAALPPSHAYVAFYLWLRHRCRIQALVHCGTHGTLEWLPGKPAALSETCAPEALLGPLPLVYPFILNNPGEAAHAKRRNAAVVIGHLTPPLIEAGAHGAAVEIEALLDEYAAAETLDPRRAALIADAICERATANGIAAESGIDVATGRAALASLDAWLCDIKEMRIRDGLHVFGRGADIACAEGERRGLLAALDGRFVPGGPAGAPSRGRLDVLPTGRNLYGTDPRAVPSRTAYEIGRRAAEAIAARYAQDHGDWPKTLVLDLWASATMRTSGEDLAQAMAHLGVRPTWDPATSRVTGFEILSYAQLERPRVDVTLRISGLFRDVFPAQITLFDQAARAVAALDEDPTINPLAAAHRAGDHAFARIFGAAPSVYGMGLGAQLTNDPAVGRAALGRAYLAAASHAYAGADAQGTLASDAFATRVAAADAFVHVQDIADLDLLDSQANVEAEAGFAAAAHALGASPALYHLDATRPDQAAVRTQAEELRRIIRGRAANPRWISGQIRHGHRGAAEIAETVDNLYAMAVMSDAVTSQQFDLVFAATCGAPHVRDFLQAANPAAAQAIARRFQDASRRGLWTSRRNSDAMILAELLDCA